MSGGSSVQLWVVFEGLDGLASNLCMYVGMEAGLGLTGREFT